MGVWGIVRIAATRIPWGRVLENVPALVDMVNRAKERLRYASGQAASSTSVCGPEELEERLILLQQENVKLGKALLQTSEHLQELIKSVEVVAARQKMMGIAAGLSLVIAISALVVALTS